MLISDPHLIRIRMFSVAWSLWIVRRSSTCSWSESVVRTPLTCGVGIVGMWCCRRSLTQLRNAKHSYIILYYYMSIVECQVYSEFVSGVIDLPQRLCGRSITPLKNSLCSTCGTESPACLTMTCTQQDKWLWRQIQLFYIPFNPCLSIDPSATASACTSPCCPWHRQHCQSSWFSLELAGGTSLVTAAVTALKDLCQHCRRSRPTLYIYTAGVFLLFDARLSHHIKIDLTWLDYRTSVLRRQRTEPVNCDTG